MGALHPTPSLTMPHIVRAQPSKTCRDPFSRLG